MTTDEAVICKAAYEHYIVQGDKIKPKTRHDPHSSYDVLRGTLTKYAYRRLGGNWQDAEDAVQDAYVHVLRTAKVNCFFNFSGLYKIWLDRSIANIRRNNYEISEVLVDNDVVDEEEGLTLIDLAEYDGADIETLIEIQHRIDVFMRKTNRLKPKEKAIIRLSLLFGYSYREVGAMLDVSFNTVRGAVVRFYKRYEK